MADIPSGSGGSGDKDDSHFPTGGGFFAGESSSGRGTNPVINDDNMNATLHQLAMEAHRAMLRYFRARDGHIPWEGESFFTELRAELGLTSEEHSSICQSFRTDETLQLIRLTRESLATPATSQLVDNRNPSTSRTGGLFRFFTPQPTNSANLPSIPVGTVVRAGRNYPTSGEGKGLFGSHVSSGVRGYEPIPLPSFSTQPTHMANQPTTSAGNVGGADRNYRTSGGGTDLIGSHVSSGVSGYEPIPLPSFSTRPTHLANLPSIPVRIRGTDRNYPTSGVGKGLFGSHVSSGGLVNEFVGRRVKISLDGHYFYEGVITDYNPREGTHTFTYDIASERVEDTVNLDQIAPERIQWLSSDTDEVRAVKLAIFESINSADSLISEATRVRDDRKSSSQEISRVLNKLQLMQEQDKSDDEDMGVTDEDTEDMFMTDEGMDDFLLSSPLEMIEPDENQIRDTHSVLNEDDRRRERDANKGQLDKGKGKME